LAALIRHKSIGKGKEETKGGGFRPANTPAKVVKVVVVKVVVVAVESVSVCGWVGGWAQP
jgi:hypothetical protein